MSHLVCGAQSGPHSTQNANQHADIAGLHKVNQGDKYLYWFICYFSKVQTFARWLGCGLKLDTSVSLFPEKRTVELNLG